MSEKILEDLEDARAERDELRRKNEILFGIIEDYRRAIQALSSLRVESIKKEEKI
jgi:hypothetical protein